MTSNRVGREVISMPPRLMESQNGARIRCAAGRLNLAAYSSGVKRLVDRNGGSGYTDPAAGVAVLPLDGACVEVVPADVVHELGGEVVGGLENASSDDVALELAEPKLDLVQPLE